VERWVSNERLVRVSALLGTLAIAFSSILVRLSHESPSTAAIFRCFFALPALGWLAWREDRRLGARSWAARRAAVAAGVFFAADLILWHHSIEDVGAGLATVLANIQVVLVPLVAWAMLAERPGRRVLAALPIALFGVVVISGVLQHGAYGRAPGRGAVFGLAAGVAYVGFLLLLRRTGSDLRRVAGPLFEATLTATVVSAIAGLAIGDAEFLPGWPGVGWLAVLALTSQVIGWLLITTSLPRLPAAITSLTLTVQPVGSVALAALILSEAPSALQLVGVGVVLCAVITATAPGVGARSGVRAGGGVSMGRGVSAGTGVGAQGVSAGAGALPEQVLRFGSDERRGAGSVPGGDVATGAADEHDRERRVLAPGEVGGGG
jgi:drug/metabolite transporter (DMT)-like permease